MLSDFNAIRFLLPCRCIVISGQLMQSYENFLIYVKKYLFAVLNLIYFNRKAPTVTLRLSFYCVMLFSVFAVVRQQWYMDSVSFLYLSLFQYQLHQYPSQQVHEREAAEQQHIYRLFAFVYPYNKIIVLIACQREQCA